MSDGQITFMAVLNSKEFQNGVTKMQRSVKKLANSTKAAGQTLSRNLSAPLVALAAVSLKSAAKLETMEASLVSLTGSAEAAGKTVDELKQFAASTPFQIDGIGQTAKSLLAAGVSSADLRDKLQEVGDVAALAGRPIEDIGRIYAKIQNLGKASFEEVNQVAEAGLPIFKTLQERLGLNRVELKKFIEAGNLTSEVFNEVFSTFNDKGGPAFQAMETRSKTLEGRFSTLVDNLENLAATIGETISESLNLKDVMVGLTDITQDLNKNLEGTSGFTKQMATFLGIAAAALGPLLIGLGQFGNLLSSSLGGLKKIGPLLANFGKGIKSLALNPLTAAVTVFIAGVTSLIGKIVRARKEAKQWANLNKNAAKAVRDHARALKEYRDGFAGLSDQQILDNLNVQDVEVALGRIDGAAKNMEQALGIQIPQDALNRIKELEKRYKGVEEFGLDPLTEAIKQYRKELQASIELSGTGEEVIVGTLDTSPAKMSEESEKFWQGLKDAWYNKQRLLSVQVEADEEIEFDSVGGDLNVFDEGALDSQLEFLRQMQDKAKELEDLTLFDAYGADIDNLEAIKERLFGVKDAAEQISPAMQQVANGVGQALGSILNGTATVSEAITRLALDTIGALLAQAVAQAITNAQAPTPDNLATGGLSGVAKAAIAQSAIVGLFSAIPAFAEGGAVLGPTLALVGEKPGSRGEAIVPFEKIGQFVDMVGGGNSGTQHVVVSGNLRGTDIELSSRRGARRRSRRH